MKATLRIILVSSGKGGVGKTTVSTALAYAFSKKGQKVGLLDCDVRNPCIPTATGMSLATLEPGDLIKPLDWHGIKVFSIGLLPMVKDCPIMLIEEDISSFIEQMFESVDWPELDIMIVDLRPGAIAEILKFNSKGVAGALVITTPEKISVQSVARMVRVLKERGVPIIGIVQNKGRFTNGERILYQGTGGYDLAKEYNLPLLVDIPFVFRIMEDTDSGVPVEGEEFNTLADKVLEFLAAKETKNAVAS